MEVGKNLIYQSINTLSRNTHLLKKTVIGEVFSDFVFPSGVN